MLSPEAVVQLKAFISLVRKTPQILHTPQLAFFKEFIESFGGVVPPFSEKPESTETPFSESTKSEPKVEEPEVEEVESDVEIDNTGVIGSLKHFIFLTYQGDKIRLIIPSLNIIFTKFQRFQMKFP